MSKSKSNLVPASAVRAFFQSNPALAEKVAADAGVRTNSVLGADGNAKAIRGRINPAFVAAFTEQTGDTYMEVPKGGNAGEAVVEVERTSPKTGRAIKSTVLPRSEALTLLGKSTSTKGVLGKADRARLAEVLTAAGR